MRLARIMIGLNVVALAAVWAVGCAPRSRAEVLISDPSRAVDLILKAPKGEKATHALTVVGTGRIEGEAQISLMLNGIPQQTQHVTGTVEFTWREDWYSPEATVRYTPSSAKTGAIRLSYRFSSL